MVIGQTIDRKLYDNLNTYTGESGSDGVVRVAAANLNSAYVRLADAGAYGVDAAELDTAGNIITNGKNARFEIGASFRMNFSVSYF